MKARVTIGNMRPTIPEILKQKPLLILSGITGGIIAINLVFLFTKLGGLSYPLVLHFDSFHGVDFLGDVSDFWGIWLGGAVLITLNFFLGGALFRKERVLSYVFFATNVLLATLLFVITAIIIATN